MNSFGSLIRNLRYSKNIGIKKLAPELNLDYTYLSRLENDKTLPSEEVVERISKYFNYNKDELLVLANKIPEDIKIILKENPTEALNYLRKRFGSADK